MYTVQQNEDADCNADIHNMLDTLRDSTPIVRPNGHIAVRMHMCNDNSVVYMGNSISKYTAPDAALAAAVKYSLGLQ